MRSRVTNNGTVVIKVFPVRAQGEVCIKCLKDTEKSIHHVVPSIYTKVLLPNVVITHNTFNMCCACHHDYEYDITNSAHKYRAELAELYIPKSPDYLLNNGVLMRSCHQKLHKAQLYALPMYKHRNVLPEDVRTQFNAFLRDFFEGDYTDEDLRKLLNKSSNYPIKAGEMVVRQLRGQQQLIDFCAGWKAHFLSGIGLTEKEAIKRGLKKGCRFVDYGYP
ncbi:MAG: hypothetical protein GF334_11025 [Candidatus Altiarchaeales archaeon]|nr:hypothetical protein [Candidatus Altiarchaeales archaeon]